VRYKLFGSSGLRVSELSLGTLTFGEEMGWGVGLDESRKVFESYAEAGGNFLDTANSYNAGTSERFVRDVLGSERDRFVIASKYSLSLRRDDPNASGNHRKSMMQAVHASLDRLGTDYIDVYWLHQWDFTTGIDEIMRGLDDLVSAGKILYIGISDAPAWVVSRANMLAELRGWSAFAGIQIEYSLIERSPDRELLPMARELDLAIALWGVVGQGVLTGKYTRNAPDPKDIDSTRTAVTGHRLTEKNLEIARTVDAIADRKGCSSSQVALNWARQQHQQMIPVIGNRTLEQTLDNLACLDNPLDESELAELNRISAIDLGFPNEFLYRDRIIDQRFGGTQELLDNHRTLNHLKP